MSFCEQPCKPYSCVAYFIPKLYYELASGIDCWFSTNPPFAEYGGGFLFWSQPPAYMFYFILNFERGSILSSNYDLCDLKVLKEQKERTERACKTLYLESAPRLLCKSKAYALTSPCCPTPPMPCKRPPNLCSDFSRFFGM